MPKINLDTDVDYIMLQHQGQRIPIPTRLAIDDGENIYGGNITSGGTASAGAAASASLTNQQNFSQIQENPLPCLAHRTFVPVWHGDQIVEIEVQDLLPGHYLKYQDRRQPVEQIQRLWCDSLWVVKCGNNEFLSSGKHHLVLDTNGPVYAQVETIQPHTLWAQASGEKATIEQCFNSGTIGWVYRIYLKDDGTPESHWYEACGGIHENAKPIDER